MLRCGWVPWRRAGTWPPADPPACCFLPLQLCPEGAAKCTAGSLPACPRPQKLRAVCDAPPLPRIPRRAQAQGAALWPAQGAGLRASWCGVLIAATAVPVALAAGPRLMTPLPSPSRRRCGGQGAVPLCGVARRRRPPLPAAPASPRCCHMAITASVTPPAPRRRPSPARHPPAPCLPPASPPFQWGAHRSMSMFATGGWCGRPMPRASSMISSCTATPSPHTWARCGAGVNWGGCGAAAARRGEGEGSTARLQRRRRFCLGSGWPSGSGHPCLSTLPARHSLNTPPPPAPAPAQRFSGVWDEYFGRWAAAPLGILGNNVEEFSWRVMVRGGAYFWCWCRDMSAPAAWCRCRGVGCRMAGAARPIAAGVTAAHLPPPPSRYARRWARRSLLWGPRWWC